MLFCVSVSVNQVSFMFRLFLCFGFSLIQCVVILIAEDENIFKLWINLIYFVILKILILPSLCSSFKRSRERVCLLSTFSFYISYPKLKLKTVYKMNDDGVTIMDMDISSKSRNNNYVSGENIIY